MINREVDRERGRYRVGGRFRKKRSNNVSERENRQYGLRPARYISNYADESDRQMTSLVASLDAALLAGCLLLKKN